MGWIGRTWNSPNRWILLLAGLLLVALAVVAVTAGVRFREATTPATPGAFYTPPNPLPAGAPGTILRREPSTAALPTGARAERIMYLSTGVDGQPVAVTGTIVAPTAPADGPRPVIAWTHGTTGIYPQCGVSHTSDPYQQTPAIQAMIDAGYVVAITDYPGLGTPGVHPYIVGPVEAASALDSVRAARQLDMGAGDRFVVWGASQGGHAALWTGQEATRYAPELTLLGVAASAPATDLAGIARARGADAGGGIFMGMLFKAWSEVYPGLSLDGLIRPDQRQQFERMVAPCFTTPLAFVLVGDLLTPEQYLQADPLTVEPWRTLLAQNTPRGRIDVPIVIAHGTADPLIPIELSEAEAARRCAEGQDVQFQRFPGVSHDAREETALFILGWVQDRFAGRPTGSTCG